MVQTERVIFREEKNPYDPNAPHYLAVFPDDPSKPGYITCVPFHYGKVLYDFSDSDGAIFEPMCDVSLGYYYQTKIIHRNDPRAEKLLQAVTDYYSSEVPAKFRMVEKMTH